MAATSGSPKGNVCILLAVMPTQGRGNGCIGGRYRLLNTLAASSSSPTTPPAYLNGEDASGPDVYGDDYCHFVGGATDFALTNRLAMLG